MKKRYISLILIILLGAGCSEYEMKEYDLMDRINFIVMDDWGQVSTDPEDMVWKGNFGMTMAAKDTLRVIVRAQGNISDKDRRVAFKVVPEGCGIEVESMGEYVLPAGEYECELKLLVNRPALQDTVFEGQLTFDYVKSDFLAGVDEQQYYTLECSDIFDQAIIDASMMWWDFVQVYDLGSWSAAKTRFITLVLGFTVTDWNGWFWVSPEQKEKLVQALEEYKANSENPPLYDETKFPEQVWISFDAN